MAGRCRPRRRGLVALSSVAGLLVVGWLAPMPWLAGVHLEQSLLCGTQFQGADLRGAHLAGARASADTRWPDGFDWGAAGARLVDAC